VIVDGIMDARHARKRASHISFDKLFAGHLDMHDDLANIAALAID